MCAVGCAIGVVSSILVKTVPLKCGGEVATHDLSLWSFGAKNDHPWEDILTSAGKTPRQILEPKNLQNSVSAFAVSLSSLLLSFNLHSHTLAVCIL